MACRKYQAADCCRTSAATSLRRYADKLRYSLSALRSARSRKSRGIFTVTFSSEYVMVLAFQIVRESLGRRGSSTNCNNLEFLGKDVTSPRPFYLYGIIRI